LAETGVTVRRVGVAAAASLVVSNMVGAGIFTTSGFLAADLRSPALLLTVWAVGGALALAGAISYGELGASLPHVGGDYVFLREAYGPLWAFMSGWMAFFAGMGAPIALTALAFVEHLTPYLPALSIQDREPLFTVLGLSPTISPGQLLAIGAIWLLTLVHYLGIRVSGRLQVALTVLNLALIVSFLVLALFSKTGDLGHFTPAAAPQSAGLKEISPVFAVSLILVLYSYSGFNAAAYIGGEIRRPERSLPRALFAGTAVVVLLYLALNAVYIYALPMEKMAGRLDVAKLAALALIGPAWGGLFSLVIAFCVLACTSAMICIAPRIYHAMALDGVFFAGAARTSKRFGTPGLALTLQAVWASLLLIIGSFSQLLTYCGFLLSLFTALTVGAVFVLRHRRPDLARPYKAWGYPLTPALYVAVALGMMIFAVFTRPLESLIGAGIVVLGVPVYLFWSRERRKVK